MKQTIKRVKAFLKRYERVLVPGMLLVGVATDFITFRTINIQMAFALLAVHFALAGLLIAFVHLYDARKEPKTSTPVRYLRLAAPFILQINLGALLSSSFIFYWFSGALSVSWPFMLILSALMASNELLREEFQKLSVQISMYYFCTFSLAALVLPFQFQSMSMWLFIVAGVGSLLFTYGYVAILSKRLEPVRRERMAIGLIVLIIYTLFNAFYFLNLIPPIPLSLREVGVYHRVERTGADYAVLAEQETFFERLTPSQIMHVAPGERVYVFTSIFAPGGLNTNIVHHWQFFNPNTGGWVDWSAPSFGVSGGRGDGYRGFSFSGNLQPGKWRVNVTTEHGQILGRVHFRVESVDEPVSLEERTK